MKLIRKSIICIIAAVAALTSCKEDNTLQYNNYTMGNVVDGTFTSDQGNIFNVVEQNCAGDLTSLKRAIVLCDVLNKVEGSDNEYDVRLNGMASVLDKAPITEAEAEADEEKTVEDPVTIQDNWIAGGYINMYIVFEVKAGSTKKHQINLVLDEAASTEGKYVFTLRHNSYGESLAYNATDIVYGGSYVSFPISELITEDSAEISVNYKWYKSVGMGWSSETQEYTNNLRYTKGGFEQAPSTLASKTTTNLN